MPSTAYEIGRRFEYRVRDHFKKLGFVVTRSPKSKSAVDLFVMGHGVLLFVQCKVNGVLPPKEWNELMDMCDMCGAQPMLASREGRKLMFFRLFGRKIASGPQPRIAVVILANTKKEPRAA